MNGPIAQFVALTCYANAFLGGQRIPEFFPANSTCKFCDWIKFFNVSKTLLGKVRQTEVATSPNAWFEQLKVQGALGVRVFVAARNDPGIPDRMSAAFVGGGGSWSLEVTDQQGKAAVWLSKWEVWNQDAPERRIWRVSYSRVSEIQSRPASSSDLTEAAARLRAALGEIYTFSQKHNCRGFTGCFAQAIDTLDSQGSILHGYHKDLAPEGCLPRMGRCLLDACQTAWVFGGMGSWNDLGFEGAAQAEYDRVSQGLFASLNQAIWTGANSSSNLTCAQKQH